MQWIENGEAEVSFICSDEKKNVFLIGDSIRRGYCLTVKRELNDIAEVYYPMDNCRNTQHVITRLKKWSNMIDDLSKIHLVQFNCGQWDAAHWNEYELSLTSESEYERNIKMIIDLLKKFFPNAKIVFATTTPINPVLGSIGAVNPRSNEEVDKYNKLAISVCKKEGVTVIDYNAYMKDWGGECYKDICHLTPEAFIELGKEVAKNLRKFL